MKRIQSIKLRSELFWDVDPKTIDFKKHAQYIIERVLEFGNDREVKWMWEFFSPRVINHVVEISRALRKETKPLWLALTE